MQIGLLARIFAILAVVGACHTDLATQNAVAQYYPAQQAYAPTGGDQPGGPSQAYNSANQGGIGNYVNNSPYIDAYGNPVIVPAGYCPSCNQGPGMGMLGGGLHGNNCPDNCMGTYPPYPDNSYDQPAWGGGLMDQCGPHYWDVRAEAVYMTRDETFGQDVIFSILIPDDDNDGIADGPPVPALQSSDLDFDHEPGFRLMGRYDLGALSVVEIGYWGIAEWTARATAVDPNGPDANGDGTLYSLFSRPAASGPTDYANYGTTPADVQTFQGSMPQTERQLYNSISLESELHTAEVSYRRYWVGFCPRLTGSWLAGFRWTNVNEDFHFVMSGNSEGMMDYGVSTRNNLTGFQVGGDVWFCLMQGLRVGTEGKAGVYNNRLNVRTTIDATDDTDGTVTNPLVTFEQFGSNQIAFIGEASFDIVADILPSWSLRAGYEVLFINSVALAGDNFNTVSPYGLLGQETRVPFLADQGSAYYHGGHAGLEFVW